MPQLHHTLNCNFSRTKFFFHLCGRRVSVGLSYGITGLQCVVTSVVFNIDLKFNILDNVGNGIGQWAMACHKEKKLIDWLIDWLIDFSYHVPSLVADYQEELPVVDYTFRSKFQGYTGWPVKHGREFLVPRIKWLVLCTRVLKRKLDKDFLQCTAKTLPCLTGHPVYFRKYFSNSYLLARMISLGGVASN